MVPSERVIVPRSLAIALPDAVGVPVVVTGGHAPAHAPEQADASLVSLVHRYTARPEPVVRNVSPDAVAVVMTVAPPAAAALLGAAAAAELAGAAGTELLLLPLEHAAASSATPTAPPTPATFTMENRIVLVSRLAGPEPARPRYFVTVTLGYGKRRVLDWIVT